MPETTTTAAERLRSPAVYRLAVYVVAGVIGLVLVATGALEADGVAAWVERASTQAGGLLAIIAGLAAKNIDRADARPIEVVVDAGSVTEAITPAVVDAITAARDNTAAQIDDAVEDGLHLLDAMRARVDAARGGEPAPGRHRMEG